MYQVIEYKIEYSVCTTLLKASASVKCNKIIYNFQYCILQINFKHCFLSEILRIYFQIKSLFSDFQV